MRALLLSLSLTAGMSVGCTEKPAAPAARSAASDPTPASTPAPADVAPSAAAAPVDAGAIVDAGAVVARAVDSGAVTEPSTDVKIVTSGMHVGGGPYDEITKEPMKRSVEPRFPDLARCWKHVTRPQQAYFGVDLVIEANGGKARVSNPRTTLEGEGFVACVVAFYQSVDFQKPRNGKTVVSYSVQFKPIARP